MATELTPSDLKILAALVDAGPDLGDLNEAGKETSQQLGLSEDGYHEALGRMKETYSIDLASMRTGAGDMEVPVIRAVTGLGKRRIERLRG